jgi:hypothetical protein
MTENHQQEISWDSEIPVVEDSGFVILPEGTEATFTVKKMAKERSQAGAPMAKLEMIAVDADGKRSYVRENVTLSPAAMFRVRKFGVAIGHLKPNEPGTIDWDSIVDCKGLCILGVEKWTGKDKQEHQSNNVKAWLAPVEETAQASREEPSFG